MRTIYFLTAKLKGNVNPEWRSQGSRLRHFLTLCALFRCIFHTHRSSVHSHLLIHCQHIFPCNLVWESYAWFLQFCWSAKLVLTQIHRHYHCHHVFWSVGLCPCKRTYRTQKVDRVRSQMGGGQSPVLTLSFEHHANSCWGSIVSRIVFSGAMGHRPKRIAFSVRWFNKRSALNSTRNCVRILTYSVRIPRMLRAWNRKLSFAHWQLTTLVPSTTGWRLIKCTNVWMRYSVAACGTTFSAIIVSLFPCLTLWNQRSHDVCASILYGTNWFAYFDVERSNYRFSIRRCFHANYGKMRPKGSQRIGNG